MPIGSATFVQAIPCAPQLATSALTFSTKKLLYLKYAKRPKFKRIDKKRSSFLFFPCEEYIFCTKKNLQEEKQAQQK